MIDKLTPFARPVFSMAQMLDWENQQISSPAQNQKLMEQAALGLARKIHKKFYPHLRKAFFLIGKGHNGGDGLRTAVWLKHWGWDTHLLLPYQEKDFKPLSQSMLKLAEINKCPQSSFSFEHIQEVLYLLEQENYPFIFIDALLGIGLKSQLKPSIATPLKQIHNKLEEIKNKKFFEIYTIALDVPTGLCTHPIIPLPSDLTLSIYSAKLEQLFSIESCKKIDYINLDLHFDAAQKIPAQAFLFPKLPSIQQSVSRKVHKYTKSPVLIIASSPQYPKTASLVAQANAACHTSIQYLTAQDTHDLPLNALCIPNDFRQVPKATLNKLLHIRPSLVVGPGLGESENAFRWVQWVVNHQDAFPTIIWDGCALKILRAHFLENISKAKHILLPHLQELRMLLGQNDFTLCDILELHSLQNWVHSRGFTLLLKGSPNYIFGQSTPIVDTYPSSHLAFAGSGDLLAGVLAALTPHFKNPMHALLYACRIHARAVKKPKDSSLISSMLSGITKQWAYFMESRKLPRFS